MARRKKRQSQQAKFAQETNISINAFANSALQRAQESTQYRAPKRNNHNYIDNELQQSLDDERVQQGDMEQSVHGDDEVKRSAQPMLQSFQSKPSPVPLNLFYPPEIWYLVAQYLGPEDVGTFARLCKATGRVLRSAGFWRQLYDRVCSNMESKLPPSLRSYRLESNNGLRARVICAVHMVHPPYAQKNSDFNSHSVPASAIDAMQASRCVSAVRLTQSPVAFDPMWECEPDAVPEVQQVAATQAPAMHKFCIMFTRQIAMQNTKVPTRGLFANENEHLGQLFIMTADSNRQLQLSSIFNKRLIKLSINLNRDMRTYCLHMQFADRPLRARAIGTVVDITLSKVVLVRYMDWWHPEFEHVAHTNG